MVDFILLVFVIVVFLGGVWIGGLYGGLSGAVNEVKIKVKEWVS